MQLYLSGGLLRTALQKARLCSAPVITFADVKRDREYQIYIVLANLRAFYFIGRR